MKYYKVTFTDKKNKYVPIERSVEVSADNETHAEYLVQTRFGSLERPKGVKATKEFMIPSTKSAISITKVVEIEGITPKRDKKK